MSIAAQQLWSAEKCGRDSLLPRVAVTARLASLEKVLPAGTLLPVILPVDDREAFFGLGIAL